MSHYVGMEQFLGPSGFSVYSDSVWCWHLTFRSLLYYLWLLVSHSLGHWLSSPSVALPLGSLCTGRHWTWLLVPVWVPTSTHTANLLPQLFFLDPFCLNYVVRSTWFVSCFGLKQKYFTRLRVSYFPCLPSLLHLKVLEISWGLWAEEYVLLIYKWKKWEEHPSYLSGIFCHHELCLHRPWIHPSTWLCFSIEGARAVVGWLLLCCLPSLCLRFLTHKGKTSSVCLQLTVN